MKLVFLKEIYDIQWAMVKHTSIQRDGNRKWPIGQEIEGWSKIW